MTLEVDRTSPLEKRVDGIRVRRCQVGKCPTITQNGKQGQDAHRATVHKER